MRFDDIARAVQGNLTEQLKLHFYRVRLILKKAEQVYEAGCRMAFGVKVYLRLVAKDEYPVSGVAVSIYEIRYGDGFNKRIAAVDLADNFIRSGPEESGRLADQDCAAKNKTKRERDKQRLTCTGATDPFPGSGEKQGRKKGDGG